VSARGGPWRQALARLRRDRAAWLSLWFLAGIALLCACVPLLPLPSPIAFELQREPGAPVPPWVEWGNSRYEPEYWPLGAVDSALVELRQQLFGSWQSGAWLGTDAKGRDVLARIAWGSRTSLLAALAAGLCSLFIGVGYGAIAGYAGGRVDRAMMRLVDVLYSLPFIFVVIFAITLLNEYRTELRDRFGIDRELVFYALIGAIYWLTMARVVRGQVLALKHAEFVLAARALGASNARILLSHVLPNVLSVVIAYLTLTIPAVMLFEAFLSFLGLGIEPPRVSFGLLAVDGIEALHPLRLCWWLVLWPALAMASVLLALNLLGDGLRDALDPRLAREGASAS
jgi:oligopeptide transport system permease protein